MLAESMIHKLYGNPIALADLAAAVFILLLLLQPLLRLLLLLP